MSEIAGSVMPGAERVTGFQQRSLACGLQEIVGADLLSVRLEARTW